MVMKNILVSLFFLLAACSNRTGGGVYVDLKEKSIISVLDMTDSIRVVQLETNEQCLLGQIEKVLFYKGTYYILDYGQQNVLCFDQNGIFLRKISDRGRGPHEYELIGDISIDPYSDQLLLSVPFGSVLSFDTNGNFTTRVDIADAGAINELFVLDPDRWLIISLYDYQILYFSKKENTIVERLYKGDVSEYPVAPLYRTYTYKDSVFFAPMFGNKTLNMTDHGRRLAYSWDFGTMNNRQKQIESFITDLKFLEARPFAPGERKYDKALALINHNLNFFIRYTREFSRYRMAVMDYNNDKIHVMYDKQEQKALVFSKTKEGLYWTKPVFLYNQDMIIAYDCTIEGIPYVSYAKEILSLTQRQIVETFNPITDNPFLVVYYLKK